MSMLHKQLYVVVFSSLPTLRYCTLSALPLAVVGSHGLGVAMNMLFLGKEAITEVYYFVMREDSVYDRKV